uniref:Uncharacterized protein n=1 Tax=Anguilla anguilla TaxID=7936 RepID=A0A0E9T5U4_ANGAN
MPSSAASLQRPHAECAKIANVFRNVLTCCIQSGHARLSTITVHLLPGLVSLRAIRKRSSEGYFCFSLDKRRSPLKRTM